MWFEVEKDLKVILSRSCWSEIDGHEWPYICTINIDYEHRSNVG